MSTDKRRTGYKCDHCGSEVVYETDAAKNEMLKDAIDKAVLVDPTRFTTRSFAAIWNQGHSIRLIKRDDPRQAISIPWADLDALRAILGTDAAVVDRKQAAWVAHAVVLKHECVNSVRAGQLATEVLKTIESLPMTNPPDQQFCD